MYSTLLEKFLENSSSYTGEFCWRICWRNLGILLEKFDEISSVLLGNFAGEFHRFCWGIPAVILENLLENSRTLLENSSIFLEKSEGFCWSTVENYAGEFQYIVGLFQDLAGAFSEEFREKSWSKNLLSTIIGDQRNSVNLQSF